MRHRTRWSFRHARHIMFSCPRVSWVNNIMNKYSHTGRYPYTHYVHVAVEWYRSVGTVLNGAATTAEDIRDNWTKIADMDKARHLNSIDGGWLWCWCDGITLSTHFAEASGEVMSAIEESKSKMHAAPVEWSAAKKSGMDPAAARASKLPPDIFTYESRDAIIYALGSECAWPGTHSYTSIFQSVLPIRISILCMNRTTSLACSRHLRSRQVCARIICPLPTESSWTCLGYDGNSWMCVSNR
jgi:hypothetical protein